MRAKLMGVWVRVMAFPAALSRVFLIGLAILVLAGFALQWEQSQRIKFLGITVNSDKIAFEIANYGQSFVGKTDYVGSIMFVTETEKSVSLFDGAIDIIPPSRSVSATINFDKAILPVARGASESSVTQLCLYSRGKLYFDTHMFKVYFRHARPRAGDGGIDAHRSSLPDLELTEYKHVFFGRPACNFTGSGNYFTYEINNASINCEPVDDGVEMKCRTDGVQPSTLEGVFDPVQTIVRFPASGRVETSRRSTATDPDDIPELRN